MEKTCVYKKQCRYLQCNQKKLIKKGGNMRRNYFYSVTLKDIICEKERTIIIGETSMLNAVLATDERKSTYEYILKIEIIKL